MLNSENTPPVLAAAPLVLRMAGSERAAAVSRRHRSLRVAGPVALAALLLTLALPSPGDAETGALTQLTGTAGCVSDAGTGGECADGTALDRVFAVSVSRDGKHAYAVSQISDAVAVFARDKSTGELTQLAGAAGCISETGTGGECVDGTGLDRPTFAAVSPDGKHVYVTSFNSNAVAVFARDKTTGALTQLDGTAGCVSDTGTGGECVDGTALVQPFHAAVSKDGKHVYVASFGSAAVAVFARDKTTGALTQLTGTAGCVSETGTGGECADGTALGQANVSAVSPDGKHVYVASFSGNAVAVFARDKTTGALTQLTSTAGCVSETGSAGECTDGNALSGVNSVAVSSDGKYVYATAFFSNAVAAFARDKTTGALTQLDGTAGCVSDTGTGGTCAVGTALANPNPLAVSKDGKSVYVPSETSDAVAVFARDKTTGALTQLAGTAGCVSETGTGGSCADGTALDGGSGVAVTSDGKSVYVATRESDSVAVFQRARK